MREGCDNKKRRAYFEGWYFKQRGAAGTVAFIPAMHLDERGQKTASLQVITERESAYVVFPEDKLFVTPGQLGIRVGKSIFSQTGCRLSHHSEGLTLEGRLRYGPFTPIEGDIMGPFRHVPGMQCRHSVLSLRHRVDGRVTVNGADYDFDNGVGYLEGDRGSAFPTRYLWTQCNWRNNCVMLSVADIPIFGGGFVGCIGVVYFGEKEYRLATYNGVKLLYVGQGAVLLRQGELALRVELLREHARPLRAPASGGMTRTVHESAACRVRYKFSVAHKVVFDLVSDAAAFESAWE